MGVDVPCDGTTEIGPINALVEAGHYDSPAYDQILGIHSQDTEWTQKARDSFDFTKITLSEWNVLSQYSLAYDLLTDRQRGQISNAILSPKSRPKGLRKVPTNYVTESTALSRFTDSFCSTPKTQKDQIQDILDAFCSTNTYSRKNVENEKPPLPFLIKRQGPLTADSISRLQIQNDPQEEGHFGGFIKRNLPSGSDILSMMTGGGNRGSRLKFSASNILGGSVSEKKIEKAGAVPPALMKYLSSMRADIPHETVGRYSYISFIKNLDLLRERLPEIKDIFKDPNDFAIWALETEAEIKSLTWKRKNERRRKYRKRIESSSSSDWTDITEEEFLTFGTETSETSCKDNNDDDGDYSNNYSNGNNIESSSDDWSNWKKNEEERWSSSSSFSESIY